MSQMRLQGRCEQSAAPRGRGEYRDPGYPAAMPIDPADVDATLTTTRAVRRRLDLDREVDNQLLLDCIDIAEQAPTGGNLTSRSCTTSGPGGG
jgi:hypothetical protein